MTATASPPPTIWATTKPGTDAGAIPAKVAENIRPTVMAGLAKLVEEVKKYAAPMYAPTAAGAAQREDHQDQAEGRDDLGQEMRGRTAALGRQAYRRLGEHQVREHRAADT